MSKVSLETLLRSRIRQVWLYSELRREALALARVARGTYRCGECKNLFGPKQVNVDHKVQVTPKGVDPKQNPREYWGKVIENMLYCGLEGLWVLCKDGCHKAKTKAERAVKKKIKSKKGKKK